MPLFGRDEAKRRFKQAKRYGNPKKKESDPDSAIHELNKAARVLYEANLYQMIRAMGGPPSKKGVAAFWESVRDEWNKEHKLCPYETWKDVKLVYDRLNRQIYKRMLLPPWP